MAKRFFKICIATFDLIEFNIAVAISKLKADLIELTKL